MPIFSHQTLAGSRLFIATFISAFLFVFGAGTLLLMFVPVWADDLTPKPSQQPQLPVSPVKDVVPTPTTTTVNTEPYPALPVTDTTTSGDWIRIPSINVNVPLVMSATINDKDVLASLDKGAALYPNGVLPGHLGNTFIAAHSTGEPWKGKYRFAFDKINQVKPGNIINLDYAGTRYTYLVIRQDLVTPKADYQVVSDRPMPTVVLMACWPLWTTQQRMLITGQLTNITKLTPTPS